jgi:hypothetical protein
MNMTSRLKKSKTIQRLKELHKTTANGDFLSALQAADTSEKHVAEKQHEIANILAHQSQHLNNKNSLNPLLMQMHAGYLSEQYQQLDNLLNVMQEKNRELDNKRHVLAKRLTQEKVFEKLVDKLETEQLKVIIKTEAIHNDRTQTSDVSLI